MGPDGNPSEMPFFPDLQAAQGCSGLLTLNESSSHDEAGAFASQVAAQVQGRCNITDGLKNNLSFGPVEFSYNNPSSNLGPNAKKSDQKVVLVSQGQLEVDD